MSLIPAACVEHDEVRKIWVAEENGKKYSLINESQHQIQKVRIDGCLSQKEGEKRCDFLFNITTKKPRTAIFVELKGSDLITAVRQTYDTLIFLKPELKGCELLVRIIGSKDVPRPKTNPAYKRLIREIPPSNFDYAINRVYSEKI